MRNRHLTFVVSDIESGLEKNPGTFETGTNRKEISENFLFSYKRFIQLKMEEIQDSWSIISK